MSHCLLGSDGNRFEKIFVKILFTFPTFRNKHWQKLLWKCNHFGHIWNLIPPNINSTQNSRVSFFPNMFSQIMFLSAPRHDSYIFAWKRFIIFSRRPRPRPCPPGNLPRFLTHVTGGKLWAKNGRPDSEKLQQNESLPKHPMYGVIYLHLPPKPPKYRYLNIPCIGCLGLGRTNKWPILQFCWEGGGKPCISQDWSSGQI